MKRYSFWARVGLTSVLVIILGVWLFQVAKYLGTGPTLDSQGETLFDPYERALNVLTSVLLPLVTLVVGYWFGAEGKDSADMQADKATKKLEAAIDVSDSGLLERAKEIHPDAFGLAAESGP